MMTFSRSNIYLLICLLTVLSASQVDAQLVTNGGFENAAVGVINGGSISGWEMQASGNVPTPPTFEIVDDTVQEGSRALKVLVNATGPNPWDIQAIAENIPVVPGNVYRYSIWAKAESPGAQLHLTVGNYSFNEYGSLRPANLSSDQWQEFTFEFAITDQETLARAPIHLSIAANVGNAIYIDNLQVVDVQPSWPGPPLATGQSRFLGCAFSGTQAPGFENYWNQVTPENSGKWGSVEATRDVMNWGQLDAAYNLAKDNGYPFRFHVLVWGNQQPAWIESLPANEQLAEIEEWMGAVSARYPDIDYVEVVNEPLHDPPAGAGNGNYIDALGGAGVTGWDWVINAFAIADTMFPPSTQLVLNDFSIVNNTTSTNQYVEIINLLQVENLIDVIGVQGHAFSTTASSQTMTTNLNTLAETGLPIMVTEMDIDGPTDAIQLQEYQRIFPLFWEHPSVIGVTLWGWRPGLWRNEQGAYIIDQNGDERPAMIWLRDYLQTFVSVDDRDVNVSENFILKDNYPNPFNPETTIEYYLPNTTSVTLAVYDIHGRHLQTLFKGRQSSGEHTARFNAESLASGVYFYQLQTPSFLTVKKMLLLK